MQLYAVREIQKYFFEICNFHTLTGPIQQMKDKHLVNLPIVSDFKKCFTAKAQHMIMLGQSQVTKTHTAIFQPKIGVTKSRNIDKMNH